MSISPDKLELNILEEDNKARDAGQHTHFPVVQREGSPPACWWWAASGVRDDHCSPGGRATHRLGTRGVGLRASTYWVRMAATSGVLFVWLS